MLRRALPARLSPRTLAVCAALLVLGIGGGTFALARGGGHHGVIHACIEKGTLGEGNDNLEFHLRKGKHCPSGWGAVSWNRRGPRGPRGPKGHHGSRGRIGLAGVTGGGADAAAGAGSNGNPPTTEGKVVETMQLKTVGAGKAYAKYGGTVVTCEAARKAPGPAPACDSSARAGLYVDGRAVPHTNVALCTGFCSVFTAGVLGNVPAGTHKVDLAVTTATPGSVSSTSGMINAFGIAG